MTRNTLSSSLAFAVLMLLVASCDKGQEIPPEQTGQAITVRNGKPIDTTPAAVRRQIEKDELARRRPGSTKPTPAPRKLSVTERTQLMDRLAKARTLPVNNAN